MKNPESGNGARQHNLSNSFTGKVPPDKPRASFPRVGSGNNFGGELTEASHEFTPADGVFDDTPRLTFSHFFAFGCLVFGWSYQRIFYFAWVFFYWGNVIKMDLTHLTYSQLINNFIITLTTLIMPLVGTKLDTYHSEKYGRRKPWIALFLVITSICSILFVWAPLNMAPAENTLWLALSVSLFSFFSPLFGASLKALVIEITPHPTDRRVMFGILNLMWEGTTLGMALFQLAIERWGYSSTFHVWVIIIALISILSLPALMALPSGSRGAGRQANVHLVPAVLQSLSSKPLRLVLILAVLDTIVLDPSAAPVQIFIFHMSPGDFATYNLINGVLVFISIPFFTFLGRFFEHKTLFAASAGFYWVLVPLLVVALPIPAPSVWPWVLLSVLNIFSGARIQYEWCMFGDAIDHDEATHGKRREVLLITARGALQALSTSICSSIPTAILASTEFKPSTTGEEPESVLWVIKWLVGSKIVIGALLIIVSQKFPITKGEFKEIQSHLFSRTLELDDEEEYWMWEHFTAYEQIKMRPLTAPDALHWVTSRRLYPWMAASLLLSVAGIGTALWAAIWAEERLGDNVSLVVVLLTSLGTLGFLSSYFSYQRIKAAYFLLNKTKRSQLINTLDQHNRRNPKPQTATADLDLSPAIHSSSSSGYGSTSG